LGDARVLLLELGRLRLTPGVVPGAGRSAALLVTLSLPEASPSPVQELAADLPT
jgi:hypothetical protein